MNQNLESILSMEDLDVYQSVTLLQKAEFLGLTVSYDKNELSIKYPKATGIDSNFLNELKLNKDLLCLMHYPMHSWNKSHHGSIHLHGHCHGSIDTENRLRRRLDVGVDSENSESYSPISLDQIFDIVDQRPNTYHHEPRAD